MLKCFGNQTMREVLESKIQEETWGVLKGDLQKMLKVWESLLPQAVNCLTASIS